MTGADDGEAGDVPDGITHEEGEVAVEIPEQRDGASAGKGESVFFNPEMELNRDVTVAVLRAYREREERAESYCDAMTASGVRAVRAANAEYDVTAADVDAEAVQLARENLARNDLDGEVVHEDANVLLHRERFDVVDVDPFGTPMPFADAAVAGTRDLLCVTATDTAPLCGAHFNSGVRKYGCVPRNTDYHAEMGLRVLLSAMVRTGARRDVALRPVCSHVTRHYARTYLELDHRATVADDCLDELGHVYHCEDCLHRDHEHGLVADPPEACPNCESTRVVTAGPIWLGAVADADFTEAVRAEIDDDMGEAKRARKLLTTVATELDTPTHYDQHRLCKEWGVPANAMDEFLADLRAAGYDATRAHYHGTAFKTDASVSEIREAAAPEPAN